MAPPAPTPALITPTASPRCLVNQGAMSIDAGTSETLAIPAPRSTQNAYHCVRVCVVERSAIEAAQTHIPTSNTALGENLSASHPTSGPNTPINSRTIDPPPTTSAWVQPKRFANTG